jgi:hypothetical protein
MRYALIIAIVLSVSLNSLSASDVQEATTKDGKTVILKSDGTWTYAEAAKPLSGGELTKPANATQSVQSDKGFYEIWFDPAKWKVTKSDDPPKEFQATHVSGDGYGYIISERISMPFDTLKNAAVSKAKSVAPDLKVDSTEYRTVNGVNVMVIKMGGTIQGIPFVYYGYYWSGKSGTLQAVMFTGENLFSQFFPDFVEFLNGVVITKP